MWTAFLFPPDDYQMRRFQMEQNNKTKEEQQNEGNNGHGQTPLDELLKKAGERGSGAVVRPTAVQDNPFPKPLSL